MTGNGNPLTAYVGITRVPSLDKLIIYRPFSPEVFQKGNAHGRTLLMQVLRQQDEVPWDDIIEMYLPRKQCGLCKFAKWQAEFTTAQWERSHPKPVCKECVQAQRLAGLPMQCTACEEWKTEAGFNIASRNYRNTNTRVCLQCVETRLCTGTCKKWLPEEKFTENQWWRANRLKLQGKCKECMPQKHRDKTCEECEITKSPDQFSTWTTENRAKGHQVCNDCLEANAEKQKWAYWTCGQCGNRKRCNGDFEIRLRMHTTSYSQRKHICDQCINAQDSRLERKRGRPLSVKGKPCMEKKSCASDAAGNVAESAQLTSRDAHADQNLKEFTDCLVQEWKWAEEHESRNEEDPLSSTRRVGRAKATHLWCYGCASKLQVAAFSLAQQRHPARRCKQCKERQVQRYASASGFKTKRLNDAEASQTAKKPTTQRQDELHADMYAAKHLLLEYAQHGLTTAVTKVLHQAGPGQQGLTALSKAFKKSA